MAWAWALLMMCADEMTKPLPSEPRTHFRFRHTLANGHIADVIPTTKRVER